MKPLGITPPANYTPQGERLLARGIDSLYIGYFGEIRRDVLDAIYAGEETVILNGLSFDVQLEPRNRYGHALDNAAMRLSLSVMSRCAESPPVMVQLKSELLWSQGFAVAYQTVLEVVSDLCDGQITGEKVSRVDLCADFDWPAGFDLNHTHTLCAKARDIAPRLYGRRFCGFTIGKGDLRASLYNKSLEIRKSGKTWFYELWGGKFQSVWRVEFQFKRGSLKRSGIETVSDLIDQGQTLWDYATKDWLTMREGEQKNVTRRPLTEFWKLVQAVRFDLQADTTRFEFPKEQGPKMDKSRFIGIVAGLTKSYARNNGFDHPLPALDDSLPAIRAKLSKDVSR